MKTNMVSQTAYQRHTSLLNYKTNGYLFIALDKPKTAVRLVFIDCTKAFDRLNTHRLMDKFCNLGVQPVL